MNTRRFPRVRVAVALLLFFVCAATNAYVGRCPTCGTVDRVEPIAYGPNPDARTPSPKPGTILGSVKGRADGKAARGLVGRRLGRKPAVAGERGTRLEIRMDKGGTRTIDVHGDPRIYRGDRVRVFRDRVELL